MKQYSFAFAEANYKANLSKENGQVNTAIVDSAFDLINRFPQVEIGRIWKDLYKAHVKSKAGGNLPKELLEILEHPAAVDIIKAADQSWLRASGVAFENLCKAILDPVCQKFNVRLHLPGELLTMFMTNRAAFDADSEDEAFFLKAIKDKDFDLFATLQRKDSGKREIFGFIQCKSSIRDRIQENTGSSLTAMTHHFWSVMIAIDYDNYLNLPKFNKLAKTCWNGFYVVDQKRKADGSMYPFSLTDQQSVLVNHIKLAKELWITKRHRLTPAWRPGLSE